MPEKLRDLPRIKGVKKKVGNYKPVQTQVPPVPVIVPGFLSIEDTELEPILNKIGRSVDKIYLAKRILRLWKKVSSATLPEIMVMLWLNERKLPYLYQADIDGGRGKRGGIVPDFVLPISGTAKVLNVQGSYWHRDKARDIQTRLSLLGKTVNGWKIDRVLYLKELDIYRRLNDVMEAAMRGIEL